MKKCILVKFMVLLILGFSNQLLSSALIPLTVNDPSVGAPITMGIPFPQGVLESPDHVRVLDKSGNEIPSQVTLVNTWEPLDYSVKWIWIFFFTDGSTEYSLEYGEEIRRAPIRGPKIKIKNGQRSGQATYVNTGPMQFVIGKRGGGFINHVLLDKEGNGIDNQDTIAKNTTARGSFLDLLDDIGVDSSHAIIHRSFREKGSGPLHAIIRLEGEYIYKRPDNRNSPFIIRIHAYAGRSYIKVYHTMTYTGVPDKHVPIEGQHENIALDADRAILDDSKTIDSGWLEPNDRIIGMGLSMNYQLGENLKYISGYREGKWYDQGIEQIIEKEISNYDKAFTFQAGPKVDRIPPVPNSDIQNRIEGFEANIGLDTKYEKEMEQASGWSDVSGSRYGVSIGIKNFLKEYPKEIEFTNEGQQFNAYLWTPNTEPLSFARSSLDRDQGMISNFAEGVTKTSELIYYFHKPNESVENIKRTVNYVLQPPVPHASAETYSKSLVYGNFAPQTNYLEYERALGHKFDWQLWNQHWEPWYGMFDWGDQKNYYFRDDWFRWQNNEPAIDFMYWLQYMRTGLPKYYHAAEAMSRHTMDVDNVHWPQDPKYYGETNESLDFFKYSKRPKEANPYLGIGRRHANQHWSALLSAHVWLKGWVASYYLTGYHRGLDIARLSADSYLRRIWGDHGLTGRRLYLSVWNLAEAWDATKDIRYYNELKDRIDIIMRLQNGPNQYDNLVIDRYGYSQIYASHGMYKYYQLTQDEKVRHSLIRHARAVRDNPPYNHEYESYFSTIHSLIVGYEFTKEKSFLQEAIHRSQTMKTEELRKPLNEFAHQGDLAEAMQKASNLPNKGDFQTRSRWATNWSPTAGLRVFGWTHIYNIPWMLTYMNEVQKE